MGVKFALRRDHRAKVPLGQTNIMHHPFSRTLRLVVRVRALPGQSHQMSRGRRDTAKLANDVRSNISNGNPEAIVNRRISGQKASLPWPLQVRFEHKQHCLKVYQFAHDAPRYLPPGLAIKSRDPVELIEDSQRRSVHNTKPRALAKNSCELEVAQANTSCW